MQNMTLDLKKLGLKTGRLPDEVEHDLSAMRRAPWEWDKIAKSTCRNNCASQSSCSFHVYAKDGVVLRQELVGHYPAYADPELPDRNPKGCQKGMVYPHRIYDPSRIKYPLKRVGERGEGKWQRVSWDQAFEEIADILVDVLVTDGPDTIAYGAGSQGVAFASDGQSFVQLFGALDVPHTNITTENGDERPGTALTFGKMIFGPSSDQYHYADVILFWGSNPAYSNISYYHCYTEARYNGTKIISIFPNYSPSAIPADLFVPVNIGTDAALALSMAHVIVRDKLYKEGFIREQTDLPLLVREDTRKFLREKDVKRGGKDEVFYFWDTATSRLTESSKKTLALDGKVPALEGEYEVETIGGKVKVRPVFELLKKQLEKYSPAEASRTTGVSPELIERLAREIGLAERVIYPVHLNWGKMYHGNLIERCTALVLVLCGQIGKKGSGLLGQGTFNLDFSLGAIEQQGDQVIAASAAADPRYATWREEGYTDEMIVYEYVREAYAKGTLTASGLFYYVHGGILDLSDKHQSWDPYLKTEGRKKPGDYVKEAIEKGHQFVMPKLGKDPRVMFSFGGDFLRRVRATHVVLDTLLPKLRLLVTVDWRMTGTGMYSDYILPACGWYEKPTLRIGGGGTIHPYCHAMNQIMEPLYDSKNEWDLFCLLAKKIEERAAQRGVVTFKDRSGKERRLDNLYDKVTVNGLYTEGDLGAVSRDIFMNSSNVEKLDWEEFKEKGYAHWTGEGKSSRSVGHSTDIVPGESIVPLKWHVERKYPYPTTTRRIQFYIDHDLFLEFGEELPTQKEDPKAGGDYPLRLTGGHTRWSIQSTHTEDALLLRLQRGEPVMWISKKDAADRGIEDGDTVEAYNDVSSFRVQVAVTPAVRPGQVIMYHGWVNYQFPGFKHFKGVMASPLNPVECAGGDYHLRPMSTTMSPGLSDRETRLELRKVSQATSP